MSEQRPKAKRPAAERRPIKRCPMCGKPAQPPSVFCSPRCQDLDLHHWLAGSYAIPVREDDSEGADPDKDEHLRSED